MIIETVADGADRVTDFAPFGRVGQGFEDFHGYGFPKIVSLWRSV
jgi:hypothetical protein